MLNLTKMEETNLILRPPHLPPFSPTVDTPPIEFSRSLSLIAAVAALVLCLLGVFGNLLTVVALLKDKKLRQKPTTSFVISLALSDLLFCTINLPLTAVRYFQQRWTLGPVVCRIFPFFFYGNVAASLMSMVAITINRYVLIAYYSNYSKIYSRRNIFIMISAVWIFSFGMIIPPLVDVWGTLGLDEATFSCTIKELDERSPKKFLFLVAFLLPSLSIIVCYSAIFYKVKSSRQKVEGHSKPGLVFKTKLINKLKMSQTLEDLKITKMMLTIFLFFLICFLPLMVVNVFDNIRQPSVHVIASILAWMSAIVNPFIYAFLNQQYQKAFRNLLMRSEEVDKPASKPKSSDGKFVIPPLVTKPSYLPSNKWVDIKFFSKEGHEFTIVSESEVHTQMQLKIMNKKNIVTREVVDV